MIQIPQFSTQKQLFAWLVANKNLLESQKKYQVKRADPFVYAPIATIDAAKVANESENQTADLQVKSIINTTNWFDSHKDVHIPGLWAKSLQEKKPLYLLQEHTMSFDHIISDEVKASVANYGFRELGIDIDGITQALVFDSVVKLDRNKFMYNQYRKGWVKNHSVGMRYVKIVMCINDEDYGAEHEAWLKYFPQVANKEECESCGYFWAVTEAKLVEGSAVPIGSNIVTPTMSIDEKAANTGTSNTTAEPQNSTQQINQKQQEATPINWDAIANKILLLN